MIDVTNQISKQIDIHHIYANNQNERSMDETQIQLLQESIEDVGLLNPLTVYPSPKQEGHYVLISGHKRLAALKLVEQDLKSWSKLDSNSSLSVLCHVVDAPESLSQEQELLAQANIHRSTPAELQNEVKLANRAWNTMDNDSRKKWREKLKARFNLHNINNPRYNEDPKEFLSDNFRPRLEYIRAITGLDMTNSTVKDILKKTLDDAGDAIGEDKLNPDKEIKSSTPKLELKKIHKTMLSLREQVIRFYETRDAHAEIMTISDNIDDMLPYVQEWYEEESEKEKNKI